MGTIPFVYIGSQINGVYGVLVGQAIGGIIFGVVGVWVAYRLIDKVEKKESVADDDLQELSPTSSSPLSSSCSQMEQLNKEKLVEQE